MLKLNEIQATDRYNASGLLSGYEKLCHCQTIDPLERLSRAYLSIRLIGFYVEFLGKKSHFRRQILFTTHVRVVILESDASVATV